MILLDFYLILPSQTIFEDTIPKVTRILLPIPTKEIISRSQRAPIHCDSLSSIWKMILVYDYIKIVKRSNVNYSKKNSLKKKPFYHEITLNFSGSIQANDENYKIKKVYLTTER